MNKKQASDMAKAMVKKKVTGFAGPLSLTPFNKGKQLTDHAASKVLTAFRELVIQRGSGYPVIEQMHCEDKLTEEL